MSTPGGIDGSSGVAFLQAGTSQVTLFGAEDEHGDGSLTLSMEVPGLAEVLRWVLGYGAEARVEAPPTLLAMVRGEVAKLAQEYGAEG